jgi:chitodextrinase
LAPAVASSGNNFLVVWYDARNGNNDIFGALVRASDGAILQNDIPISTAAGAQNAPSVAYDPASNNYFVVWTDGRNGNFDIFGARVNASTGAVVDPAGILIANATRSNGTAAVQQFPSVASGGGVFWVTWEDGRNSTSSNLIFGARVNASTGALLDAAGTGVFVGSTASPQKFPTSAYNGSQFLTVWQDQRNASIGNDWDIYGKLVTAPATGAVTVGPLIPIARTRGPQQVPAVGFGLGNFFVVWEDMRDHLGCTSANNCDWNPYAAWVRPDGVVMDNLNIFLTRRPNAQRKPALSFGISNYFTVWEDYWEGGTLNQPEIWGQGRGNANFFRPGLGDDTTPPSAPTNLQAAAASTTEIDLSWSPSTDNSNGVGVSSYFVFRNGSRIANTTNITYSDTNRTPNTTYTYTVIAVDGDGNESAQSSAVSATTLSNIDLIASSVGTSASARSGSTITVTHTLQNKGTGNAGSFVVKYYLASDDPVTSGTLLTTRSFPSGLASGAAFTESFSLIIPAGMGQGIYALGMIVDADNQVVESDEENNLLTLPITIDDTPPTVSLTAPTNGSNLCCAVTVAASAGDNFEMSLLIFLLDGTPVSQDMDGADGWSWTWNTVTATDGSHALTAKAVDAAGNSTVSAAVTVQVYNPPVAPTGLSVADVAGDQGGALRLTWTVSTSTDITQQRIYRGTASGGPYSLVTTITGNTTSSYTNTGLTNGTTYYYVVRAYDGTTESGNSNVGSAIPRDNLAPTLSNVAASSITTGGATITWTTNEASDTQVEYGTTTAYGNSTTLNTAMVTSHSATLTGLSSSTLYHYRVKSRDAAGNLATGGDFTFTTASPGGPDLTQLWVAISTITSSSITINDVVGNIGNQNAGAFDVGFYLSTDTSYQTTDTFLCKRSLSGLAAGTNNPPSGTATTTCSISGIGPGSYYLIAVSDSGQVIAETNETNNTFSTGLPIGPDLIVSLFSASKSGSTLTIQSAAKNQGNRNSGAFDIGFYLSTDTTLDTSSDYFVCKRSIASLAVGASDPPSGATTGTCTLPAVPAGSYYVIAFADSTRVITEYNENNNTQVGANITVP